MKYREVNDNGVVRRRSKRLWLVVLSVFLTVFCFSFLKQKYYSDDSVEAASLADFDPGYIISDYVMGDYSSMSESEIQAFLTAKNSCKNTDYDLYLRLTASSGEGWHFKDGHFVCLSEELFGDGEVIGSGESAAHIIWQAAQDYRINPKVLIVLLQKETSLITDSIPNKWDYRKATGYGCPDTAPCSSQYYGFKNQVRKAAALFRTVLDGGWTNYPLGNNYVQYNPNPDCGGSVVNIRSLATSALYRYTPYQPNEGALAAGYGTAYCGAYGNRNFYLFFQDWFGGVTKDGLILPVSSDVIEGEYVLLSNIDNNMVLDIAGGADNAMDESNIYLSEKEDMGEQKWKIKNNEDGSYSIINPATEKALDVQGASKIKGANVQLFRFNNTCAQKWQIVENDDETYTIYSSCSGLALDVSGGVANSGTNINVWRANGSDAQKWILFPVKTVEDGEYVISSALSDNIVVDIDGGVSTAMDGSNIQVFRNNYTAAQEWNFIYNNEDGSYSIINPATEKALDVQGASKIKGANVQLFRFNNTCAQKWQIVENDDETYTIYSSCSGLALDVSGGVANSGTNINVWRANGSDAQKWTLRKYDLLNKDKMGGYYNVVSALDLGKSIDISGGVNTATLGTNIQLWHNNGTKAQLWYFQYNADESYTLVNTDTGKVLDVSNASTQKGANVQLWNSNETCAQKWFLENDIIDGYYVFKSACSELVMDVSGGLGNDGANINLWQRNGTNAQKWILERRIE